jgi:hypothetical protein
MILGFDLDGTYAADLKVFSRIAQVCTDAGHTCIMVTNRCEQDRVFVEDLIERRMPVLFSCGKPKREVAEAAGYYVQVWIEDNPILVELGAAGMNEVGFFVDGHKYQG